MKRRILGDITTQIHEAAGGDTEGFLPATGEVTLKRRDVCTLCGRSASAIAALVTAVDKLIGNATCIGGYGTETVRAALAPFRSSDQEK